MEPADAAGLLVRAVALQPRGQSVNQVGTQNEVPECSHARHIPHYTVIT